MIEEDLEELLGSRGEELMSWDLRELEAQQCVKEEEEDDTPMPMKKFETNLLAFFFTKPLQFSSNRNQMLNAVRRLQTKLRMQYSASFMIREKTKRKPSNRPWIGSFGQYPLTLKKLHLTQPSTCSFIGEQQEEEEEDEESP